MGTRASTTSSDQTDRRGGIGSRCSTGGDRQLFRNLEIDGTCITAFTAIAAHTKGG